VVRVPRLSASGVLRHLVAPATHDQQAELGSAGLEAAAPFGIKCPLSPTRVCVCRRPQRKRWSTKDPVASQMRVLCVSLGGSLRSAVRMTRPIYSPQTREYPVLVV
jgi:hypothetical protein